MRLPLIAALTLAAIRLGSALPNGLALTPPMGFNSWTSYGCGVTADDLLSAASFFETSGLGAVGYEYINTDDCWMGGRNATTGKPTPNLSKFPQGIDGLAAALHAKGFKFGIYSAASSVVCSGNIGTLYYEQIDAQTYAEWGVDYVKYDNCGEYGMGIARFNAFADAVAATGRPMVISTEPFLLTPNPLHAGFANLWRTGNDISANWGTIINRADMNARWHAFGGPGHWNDPDMLQVGNGGLTDAECRTHFGLWALSKAPLILGSDVAKLTPTQLAIVGNKAVIAINQDPLGVQARKIGLDGKFVQKFVGLSPCWLANVNTTTEAGPGYNGVVQESFSWKTVTLNATRGTFALVNAASGRCLSLQPYLSTSPIPVLLPCVDISENPTQEWYFPPSAVNTTGGLSELYSVVTGLVLAVSNSTMLVGPHGKDAVPLPDASYGLLSLYLTQSSPEPPCHSRGCQNYEPSQLWYYSPRLKTITLGNSEAYGYRCYEGPCYQLSDHLPSTSTYCLAEVASVSNDGFNPQNTGTGDVWGGPLSNGDYAFGLVNRGATTAPITANWDMLEVPGIGQDTLGCITELYTGATSKATGGVTFTLGSHDIAVLRVTFGASCT